MTREDFYNLVYNDVIRSAAQALNYPLTSFSTLAVDRKLPVDAASKFSVQMLFEDVKARRKDFISWRAFQAHCVYDALHHVYAVTNRGEITLVDLDKAYQCVSAAPSTEHPTTLVRIMHALNYPLPTTVSEEDKALVVAEVRHSGLQDIELIKFLMKLYLKTHNPAILLTFSNLCNDDKVTVPWLVCMQQEQIVEKEESAFCKDIEALQEIKGSYAMLQEVLRVAACMPVTAWQGDYMSVFERAWDKLHNR